MYSLNASFIAKFQTRAERRTGKYATLKTMPPEEINDNSLENLNEGQIRSAGISQQQRRKLLKRAFILGTLAEAKSYRKKNGDLVKYKLNFVTLTISGECELKVKESNAVLLNTFLTDMRRNCNMTNYLWRLEHQENGKIHYHIITDADVNFSYIRHVWNRIQIAAGTMRTFTEKFSKMSFSDYVEYMMTNYGDKIDQAKLPKWFAKGCREKWENPNSVDVVPVYDEKALNYYIAKYIAKTEDNTDLSGRIWGSSSALSKASDLDFMLQDVLDFAYQKTIDHKHSEEFEMEYCTLVFVNWHSLFAWYPFLKTEILTAYRNEAGLIPFQPIQGIMALYVPN